MTNIIGAVAGLLLVAVSAAGQKSWTVPRTPDGQPDLQGIWNNATLTPLERPAQYAEKTTLSAAEAVEFEKRNSAASTPIGATARRSPM